MFPAQATQSPGYVVTLPQPTWTNRNSSLSSLTAQFLQKWLFSHSPGGIRQEARVLGTNHSRRAPLPSACLHSLAPTACLHSLTTPPHCLFALTHHSPHCLLSLKSPLTACLHSLSLSPPHPHVPIPTLPSPDNVTHSSSHASSDSPSSKTKLKFPAGQ